MKIKFNKKNIKNYCLILFTISCISIVPSIMLGSVGNKPTENISDNFSKDLSNSKSSNFVLSNNNNPVATTANNIIMPNLNSSNNLDLKNSPMQYYTADDFYFSGYALLTNSNAAVGNYDQVTKFSSQSTTTGKAEWIVKKTDLGQIINVTNASELKINSIQFVLGNILSDLPSSVMVLLNSTNTASSGTYLFRIIWDGVDKGKYELVSKVGIENYNFMLYTNPQLSIYNFPPASNAGTIDLEIKYVNVNVNSIPTPFPTPKKILVPKNIVDSYFSSDSSAFNIFYLNNNIYIVYQTKISSTNLNNFFTIMQISQNNILNNIDISITNSSIAKLDLETLFIGNQAIFNVTNSDYLSSFVFINNRSNTLSLLLSQGSKTPSTNQSGNYASININLTNLFTTTPNIIISRFAYPPNSGYYFVNVKELYTNNSNQAIGYVALDSNNFVVELGLNFEYKRSLYNFETATPSLGKIYNIYTKPMDQNWYAQMVDTTLAQMYSNSLIGQWDLIFVEATSLELPAIINIRPSTDVLDGAIFTKVANDTNNGYSTEFTRLMGDITSYSKFLYIIFTDPKLGSRLPDIKITYSNFSPSNTNNHSIELTFTQTLRTLDKNGVPVTGSTTSTRVIGKSVFNFINAQGEIFTSNSLNNGFEIPLFIKNSLPSSITTEIAFDYLLRTQNILNPKLLLKPNDLFGTLTIDIEIPYMWLNNSLVLNNVISFNFGTEGTPYFLSNPLSQQDISVTLYNNAFLLQNPAIKRGLTIKYGGTLPSQLTKTDIINDFVKFGSAFSDPNNDSHISKLTNNDINIVPLDSNGELFVEFVFAKIGNQTNVRYSFAINDVFLSNPTANDSVYFAFKSNEEVLNTDIDDNPNTTEVYRNFRPSQLIPNLINSANTQMQLQTLANYASFSTYFANILNATSPIGNTLMSISAETDDASGLLTVIINLDNPLPNSQEKVIRKTFTGFRKAGNIIGSQSSFVFGDLTRPNPLLERSPSSITENDLMLNGVLQMSGQTANLNKEITLLPINESGTLSVTVKFFNWVDVVGGVTSIVPIKEFNRIYIGFPFTKPALNAVVWKSFPELDASYKTLNVTDFINVLTNTFDNGYTQLKELANLSDHLDSFLQNNLDKIEINYTPNSTNGSIIINVSILGLGSSAVSSFSTTISGFVVAQSIPIVTWIDTNNPIIQNLKDSKFASDVGVSFSDIGLFYSITGAETFTQKDAHASYDDAKGELIITLTFKNNSQDNPPPESRTYDGFKINAPIYKGTNWELISMAIGIPLIVLGIPLIILLIIRFSVDKRKVIKKLNARLDQQNKKGGKRRKIRSTKDLVE